MNYKQNIEQLGTNENEFDYEKEITAIRKYEKELTAKQIEAATHLADLMKGLDERTALDVSGESIMELKRQRIDWRKKRIIQEQIDEKRKELASLQKGLDEYVPANENETGMEQK